MPDPREFDDSSLQAPAKLTDALATLSKARVFVPPRVDEVVLATAREYLTARQGAGRGMAPSAAVAQSPAPREISRRLAQLWSLWTGAPGRLVWRPLAPWAALAAALMLAAWLVRVFLGNEPAGRLVSREQLERGIRVDILDAFALAREIDAGQAPLRSDLNGDGVVDRLDVDLLAARAVNLGKGGGS